jgi:hypothetical protein
MNQILKNVLHVAEEVAVKAVPGAGLVDSGVHAIIDHRVEAGVITVATGAVELINQVKGVDIADSDLFNTGLSEMASGLAKVKRSLKVTDPQVQM